MWIRIPDDVPIHRPSVGAMSLTMGSQEPDNFDHNFKAYVYRGTGVDTLTPNMFLKPTPKRKARPTRRKTNRRRTRRKPASAPRYVPRYYVPPEPEEFPETEPAPFPFKSPRPSPGWEPLTGEDMDVLLAEFDV